MQEKDGPDKKIATLMMAERGARMRRFLESKEWDDLQFAISIEQVQADVKRSFHPQSRGLDEPELSRAYYAGIFDLAERIPQLIKNMIADGEEAEKSLEKEKSREAGK